MQSKVASSERRNGGDQATIRDSAGELWSKISGRVAIFLVTDPRGASIAGAQISVEQIPSASEPQRAVSGSEGRFAVALARR